ncbi:hypothetical protein CLDAP_15890 [Caldilinea aerophila DSM 14535 = NBRC 104270]|uniref:Uncharacterized protein n=1 Tax=Caldilinea aerophila (strain DSM 14535 / JCM 11387 / NBRC 104270 / STL-6-O1) TaxID=926550 RepID=I0I2Z1_CALAS|nr:hypothetical protein CLDAP_15890 [Caldilinea aerophila DSM 14535 = NBRC 104270]
MRFGAPCAGRHRPHNTPKAIQNGPLTPSDAPPHGHLAPKRPRTAPPLAPDALPAVPQRVVLHSRP